mgnify:CR=1 FL=1
MGSSILKELGATTVGRLYQKHYGRVTAPRRILVYLAEMIDEHEKDNAALLSRVEALETELEKIHKMVSAKGDRATAQTKKRGKRNGNY